MYIGGYAYFPQNPVGTTYAGVAANPTYFIAGGAGDNDQWRIYAESAAANYVNLVIQTEDDVDGLESITLRHKKTYSPYTTVDALISKFDSITTNVNLTVRGEISASGNVIAAAFFESSDIRLKDVVNSYDSLDFKTIEYQWKDKRDTKIHWGYAAQEVKTFLPDAVHENKDGYLALDYNQTHTYKIAMLEKRIVELEKQLEELLKDKK